MFSQRMRKISPGRRPESSMINSTEDRKSTRLNSSHLVISYAVFCLKKKKHSLTIVSVMKLHLSSNLSNVVQLSPQIYAFSCDTMSWLYIDSPPRDVIRVVNHA